MFEGVVDMWLQLFTVFDSKMQSFTGFALRQNVVN